MYFIPRNNRLYNWAVKKSSLYLYTVTACVLLLLVGGWFYGMYAWVEHIIDQRQQEVARMYEQCMKIKQSRMMCSSLEKNLTSLKEKMRMQVIHETVQRGFHEYTLFVVQQARKAGLHLASYSSFSCKDGGWCVKNSAQFHFQGELERITSFLSALKKSKKMIECNDVVLTRVNNNQFLFAVNVNFSAIKRDHLDV